MHLPLRSPVSQNPIAHWVSESLRHRSRNCRPIAHLLFRASRSKRSHIVGTVLCRLYKMVQTHTPLQSRLNHWFVLLREILDQKAIRMQVKSFEEQQIRESSPQRTAVIHLPWPPDSREISWEVSLILHLLQFFSFRSHLRCGHKTTQTWCFGASHKCFATRGNCRCRSQLQSQMLCTHSSYAVLYESITRVCLFVCRMCHRSVPVIQTEPVIGLSVGHSLEGCDDPTSVCCITCRCVKHFLSDNHNDWMLKWLVIIVLVHGQCSINSIK
jgi:hypothetical protein